MIVVAGVSATQPQPEVWNPESDFFLPDLEAVMFSYAEFAQSRTLRREAIRYGLRNQFTIPDHVKIFVDNGCFSLLKKGLLNLAGYMDFISATSPDWCPVPRDFIPTPEMPDDEQLQCIINTMSQNRSNPGLVPVIHACRFISEYIRMMRSSGIISELSVGGIVPILRQFPPRNLQEMLNNSINLIRTSFGDSRIHYFGMGGIISLHLAGLASATTVDSSSWRVNSTFGMVFIPRNGDNQRSIAQVEGFGKRIRKLTNKEKLSLEGCECPVCQSKEKIDFSQRGVEGYSKRATHNLWTILGETSQIEQHKDQGDYEEWVGHRVKGSSYSPLIHLILGHSSQSSLF